MAVIKKGRAKKHVSIVADRKSITPDMSELSKLGISTSHIALNTVGYFMFKAVSPEQYKGKRVIVFHGSPDGTIAPKSFKAFEENKDSFDMIFCCYPKIMRRSLDDSRVQWPTVNRQLEARIKEVNNHLFITIREREK